jgi:hydrogenase expression/formation protein HypC
MCVAEVGLVLDVQPGGDAIVDVDGRTQHVSLIALVLEEVEPKPGDWVLLHTGFAIEVLDEPEALELAVLARDVRAPREHA